jgi:hypothetical protein
MAPAAASPALAASIQSISSTSGSGTFGVGDSVNVTVTFDEGVDFTANGGTLQVTLSNGETLTLADADAANHTMFSGIYTIQEGGTDSADLDAAGVSLTGSATLVANDDGMPADLSLPAGQNLADNQDIVVDANTPGAMLLDLNAASDTGTSDTDNLTSLATPTISGITESGATVSVRVGGASIGSAAADGAGSWSFTFAEGDLSGGANIIDIIASDAVNTSADSPDLTVTLDTGAPALSAVDLVSASDTGTSNTDDITADATPTIAFTAENGATVEIDWGGGSGFTAAASGTGASQQETLGAPYGTDGDKTVTVRASDTAGNQTTQTLSLTIDTTGPTPALTSPAATTSLDPFPATIDFAEAVTGFTTADITVGGAGGTVDSMADQGGGRFSATVDAAAEGTVTLDVAGGIAQDLAGNANAPATQLSITVDTTAPVVTVDALTTSDATPPLTGSVDDDSALLLLSVGGQTAAPVNNGDGTWTLPDDTLAPLSEGTFDVAVTAMDEAGNIGGDDTTDELTVEPDGDNDGVDSSEEDAVPTPGGGSPGDGNGDGIQDSVQENVTSLQTINGGGEYATLDSTLTPGASLKQVQAVSLPADFPSGALAPYGAFRFVVMNVSVSVTMQILVPLDTSIDGYYKRNGDGDWTDISTSVAHDDPNAVNPKTRITFSIVDNGEFDEDHASGIIRDDGVPGALDDQPQPIPTLSEWGMITMALLMAATVLRQRRKGRTESEIEPSPIGSYI